MVITTASRPGPLEPQQLIHDSALLRDFWNDLLNHQEPTSEEAAFSAVVQNAVLAHLRSLADRGAVELVDVAPGAPVWHTETYVAGMARAPPVYPIHCLVATLDPVPFPDRATVCEDAIRTLDSLCGLDGNAADDPPNPSPRVRIYTTTVAINIRLGEPQDWPHVNGAYSIRCRKDTLR